MNIYKMRAEDAARDVNFREKYDHAVARAVARMNSLSEYCLPFVKPNGQFIAYKSGDLTEIEEAKSAYKTLKEVESKIKEDFWSFYLFADFLYIAIFEEFYKCICQPRAAQTKQETCVCR